MTEKIDNPYEYDYDSDADNIFTIRFPSSCSVTLLKRHSIGSGFRSPRLTRPFSMQVNGPKEFVFCKVSFMTKVLIRNCVRTLYWRHVTL